MSIMDKLEWFGFEFCKTSSQVLVLQKQKQLGVGLDVIPFYLNH